MLKQIRIRAAKSAFFLVMVLSMSASTFASESDQFFAWGRTLKDSLELANEKFNLDMQEVLTSVNGSNTGVNYSCEAVVDRFIGKFSFFIGKNWPELWGQSNPLVDRVPSTKEDKRNYKKFGIFGPFYIFDWGVIAGPSATLRINGVNLGADKLGHHFVEGGKYFRVYSRAIRAGKSPEEAEKKAIDLGISLEKGKLGLKTSGVFSNGDLEANYQGFRFYRSLCEEGGLEKTPKGWVLKKPYDARNYVNLDWDESLNGSAYKAYRWNKVKRRLVHYCPFLQNPEVIALKKRYLERPVAETSASKKYIASLIAEGKILDPVLQSLEGVCQVHEVSNEEIEESALVD